MEGPVKLMRTTSSLLRSPTTKSITSLSAVDEEEAGNDYDDDNSKTHKPICTGNQSNTPSGLSSSSSSSSYCCCFSNTVLPLLYISFSSLSFLGFFLSFYIRGDIPTYSNLLLALAIFSGASVLAWRSKLFRSRAPRGTRADGSVEWFIGDGERAIRKEKDNGGGSGDGSGIVREGVEFYGSGDYYEGEFHKGRCNGSGVYSYFGNGRYEGDWVDGRYDGYGVESWSKGSRYRGQYRQGLRHGFGVYRFYTGDSYSGEWVNGQSHGVGVQGCSDGSCYVGGFRCGVKHALGCYHFRNGDRYAGEYFGNKIHGFGIYNFANGHCYEGSWHEGRKQGFGSYVFRNGDTRSGEWDCGVLKTPYPPTSNAVQRAVQAARKVEANALLIPKIDERVEEAVAAANRAATAARVTAIKAVQNRMDGKFCNLDV